MMGDRETQRTEYDDRRETERQLRTADDDR
jgi:hypothetical protein